VSRQGTDDILLSWVDDWEAVANCGVDVFRGVSPDPATFIPISGPGAVLGSSFVNFSAARQGEPNFYYSVYVH